MILKASQRGGAVALGHHLLKAEENEHVEIHDIRGFACENVLGAMKEIQAISMGTRCKQPVFSISLNPPETESVRVEVFETALQRIEERMKAKRSTASASFRSSRSRVTSFPKLE